MKAHKITLLVIDHEDHGVDDACACLVNASCDPVIMGRETADVGEWSDDHPLNQYPKMEEEFKRVFNGGHIVSKGRVLAFPDSILDEETSALAHEVLNKGMDLSDSLDRLSEKLPEGYASQFFGRHWDLLKISEIAREAE